MSTQLLYLEMLNTRQLISPTLCFLSSHPLTKGVIKISSNPVKQYECPFCSILRMLLILKLKEYFQLYVLSKSIQD